MEDKVKMDELIQQMKLMNEKMEKITKLLGQSMYHQQRTDFTSEYVARQQGYTGFINEDIAVAPKPPSRLFGNHFIDITDTRLGEAYILRKAKQLEGDIGDWGKRWGIIDTRVDDIHDYRKLKDDGYTKITYYLKSLTEDDTDKEDFIWLKGKVKLGEEIERRPWKEGEMKLKYRENANREWSVYEPLTATQTREQLEARGFLFEDESKEVEVEIIHRVPVLTEANDLGGEMRRAKAEAEEKEKQERLKREAKEKQERGEREELEKKRKYEESLRNRTERGEKFEFTPEQLHEIVNNTPEGQRLLLEQKRRLEEEANALPREDSRVASLADKVDENLAFGESNSKV